MSANYYMFIHESEIVRGMYIHVIAMSAAAVPARVRR